MRSRVSRHLKHLTVSIMLLGTVGVLAGTTGMLASTSTACGCGVQKLELVNKEGKELVKKDFTLTSGAGHFESVGGDRLSCTADSGTGKYVNISLSEATIKFTGCSAFTNECNSAGAASGEIVVFADLNLEFVRDPLLGDREEPVWRVKPGTWKSNAAPDRESECKDQL